MTRLARRSVLQRTAAGMVLVRSCWARPPAPGARTIRGHPGDRTDTPEDGRVRASPPSSISHPSHRLDPAIRSAPSVGDLLSSTGCTTARTPFPAPPPGRTGPARTWSPSRTRARRSRGPTGSTCGAAPRWWTSRTPPASAGRVIALATGPRTGRAEAARAVPRRLEDAATFALEPDPVLANPDGPAARTERRSPRPPGSVIRSCSGTRRREQWVV